MKLSLHSDEINLLIYRYLQESGFLHTAFAFKAEAGLIRPITLPVSISNEKFNISTSSPSLTDQLGPRLPPNCLVSMLQKALLYIWIEFHTDAETGEEIPCNQPFGLFFRHECRMYEKNEDFTEEGSEDETLATTSSADCLPNRADHLQNDSTLESKNKMLSMLPFYSSSTRTNRRGIPTVRSKAVKRRKTATSKNIVQSPLTSI